MPPGAASQTAAPGRPGLGILGHRRHAVALGRPLREGRVRRRGGRAGLGASPRQGHAPAGGVAPQGRRAPRIITLMR